MSGGDFSGALLLLGQLAEKVGHLAKAQSALGQLDGNAIIRVAELQPGMVVPGVGEVTEVGPCPGCGNEVCENIQFTLNGEKMLLDRDIEMLVEHRTDQAP